MIRVSMEVRDMIEEEKIIPREPLNDCIKRLIVENRENKASVLNMVHYNTPLNFKPSEIAKEKFAQAFKLGDTSPTVTEPIKIEHGEAAIQIQKEFN